MTLKHKSTFSKHPKRDTHTSKNFHKTNGSFNHFAALRGAPVPIILLAISVALPLMGPATYLLFLVFLSKVDHNIK